MNDRKSWWGWAGKTATLMWGLVAVLAVAGCGFEPSAPKGPAVPSGPPGTVAPAPQASCTKKATDESSLQQSLDDATAGDTVCVSGDLSDVQLQIEKGGSAQSPIHLLGEGRTRIKGISVTADNVVVDGFIADHPRAPGASLKGTNITLQNTIIDSPQRDDGDGIRFWGDNIKILHNTISHTKNERGSHADCMQTFATDEDSPGSHNVVIDGNRCEDIDNNCLIVEGPNSSAGDGSGDGDTNNITFSDNFCDNRAAQAVLIDDAQHVTITGNEIAGDVNHAWALQNQATGAVIKDNKVDAVRYEVGMDSSSRSGYQGPPAGGAP